MLRSFYAKLSLVTLLLFVVVGVLYLGLTMYSANRYFQEVQQKLNQELAAHLVQDKILMIDGSVNREELEEVFHMLMVINPSIEIYLLDPQGAILAFSAKPGTVVRERVSIEPIRAFLGTPSLPVFGDDPRDSQREKVFSAARISSNGAATSGESSAPLQGYLYVVLGGQEYDSAAEMVQASHILRLSSVLVVIGIVCALFVALGAFYFLTRRLRALSTRMDQFSRSFTSNAYARASTEERPGNGDEIASLEASFQQMSFVLRDQLDRLEQGDRLRRQLVANVSHDLRTPLTALHGYLETLSVRDSAASALNEKERRGYVAIALRHSERLGKLVSELFELARLDARDVRPDFESFSLAELVQDVVQDFRLKAEAQGLNLSARLREHPPYVRGDIRLIERLLENLIENAIRCTRSGGTIDVSLRPVGERVQVDIRDTGCGIAEEELPFVFDRAWAGASDRDGERAGAGLGLAIAKRIVDLHDNALSVSSQLGEGSCFSFRLDSSR